VGFAAFPKQAANNIGAVAVFAGVLLP